MKREKLKITISNSLIAYNLKIVTANPLALVIITKKSKPHITENVCFYFNY